MLGAFLALIAGGVLAPTAVAAPGQLDPSFGNGGIVSTPVGDISFADAIGRQSDGKLVVAGCSLGQSEGGSSQFGIARYTMGGNLDPSFGNDGVAFVPFPNSSSSESSSSDCVEDLTIRPNDSIILAGSAGSAPDQGFAVAQLTPDGQLDDSFGTDGRVRLHPGNPENSASATAIALDPAGRAVIAGQAWTGSRVNGLSVPVFAAVRIESDGALDTNFGEVLMEMTENPRGAGGVLPSSAVADIARYPDGRIVLAGTAYDEWQDSHQGFQDRLAIVRLDSDGELDPSFSGDGKLVTPVRDVTDNASGNAAAVTPDGRITVGGWLNHVSLVARFEQGGEPDLAFGSEGSTLLSDLGGDEAAVQAMRYQSDGKLVTAGVADPPTEFPRFGVARLDVNGEPDPSFGANGVVSGPPFALGDSWRGAYGYDLVLEPSGDFVVAGREWGYQGPENFALARYQGDPVAPRAEAPAPPTPAPASPSHRIDFRAIGDSVTAGFGYNEAGRPVPRSTIARVCVLYEEPQSPECQSPNNVSYPAFFAHEAGIPNYALANYAESGSTPKDWLQGRLSGRLKEVVEDDPDLTALTLGANPLLTNAVFGLGNLCASALAPPAVRLCIRADLAAHKLVPRLTAILVRLLSAPDNHVAVFEYHDTVPVPLLFARPDILTDELNGAIAKAVKKAGKISGVSLRLVLVSPGSFAKHHCDTSHPWVLASDYCIHPNALGYRQYASALMWAAQHFGLVK